MTLHGECLCGSAKVEVDDSQGPLSTLTCRCANCLAASSGVASLVSVLDESAVKFSGTIKDYSDSATESGTTITRSFCPNCGSSLRINTPNLPGKTVLKYGVFAKSHAGKYPKPSGELFCRHLNGWEKSVDGAAQYQAGPKQSLS